MQVCGVHVKAGVNNMSHSLDVCVSLMSMHMSIRSAAKVADISDASSEQVKQL